MAAVEGGNPQEPGSPDEFDLITEVGTAESASYPGILRLPDDAAHDGGPRRGNNCAAPRLHLPQ
uniref:Uncharacterized protein n=1 Tax=Magnetospirillum gryphiswaldense TaxID=55518 RepID=A4U3C1_9PROT|nr:hypothetical protein MGR_1047 [Magnetospirillum gryphiswaldense MSR-1]